MRLPSGSFARRSTVTPLKRRNERIESQCLLLRGSPRIDYGTPRTHPSISATPNETPSPRAPCKRQTPQLVLLRRPRGQTTGHRSRFPGVKVLHKLAAIYAQQPGATGVAMQWVRRVPTLRTLGTK